MESQSRQYLLSQRLVVLGLFIGKRQELADNQELDQAEALIRFYMGILAGGTLRESMEEIPN